MLENIWKRVPFVDTEEYIRHVEYNGFPLIQANESFAPPGDTFNSLIVIDPVVILAGKDKIVTVKQRMVEALPIMVNIGNTLGIPSSVIFDRNGNWIRASNRASDIAQKHWENSLFGKNSEQDNKSG